MREILFRGKRCDNDEWVQGYYIRADHHWHKHGVHKEWIVCGASANGGRIIDIQGADYIADHLIDMGVTLNQWIPVTERLPETREEVLVSTRNEYYGTRKIAKACCYDGEWHGQGGRWTNVTHWMPLPEPPEY